jgi:hypothetical protein
MLGLSESTVTNDCFKTSKQTQITTRTKLSVQDIILLTETTEIKDFPPTMPTVKIRMSRRKWVLAQDGITSTRESHKLSALLFFQFIYTNVVRRG